MKRIAFKRYTGIETAGATKILILTREPELRDRLVNLMKLWSSEFSVCTGIARAFSTLVEAAARGAPFSAVILDVPSLDMNPAQFARALEWEAELERPRIICLAPKLSAVQRKDLASAGVRGLVRLPLDYRELFKALHDGDAKPGTGGIIDLCGREAELRQLSRLEILIGDGDRINQQRMSALFQRSGHHTFLVEEGGDALDALDGHEFDLVILNAELPGISGLDTFRLYRFSRPDERHPPFVLLLDHDSPELLARCTEAGVDACLAKPVPDERLMETLVSLAGRPPGEGHAPATVEAPATGPAEEIDFRRLNELRALGGADDFLGRLVERFGRSLDQLIAAMERAVADGDAARFRDLGQSLKENAGNLGAVRLQRFGMEALALGDGDFESQAAGLLNDIRRARRSTESALRGILAEPSRLPPRRGN